MTDYVKALYRYPVKSMLGETISSTRLSEKGIPGDRAWALRDEVRGGIRGGKKIASLMHLRSRYLEEPSDGDAPAPAPEITLPDGESFRASDPTASRRVSAAVDQEVTLWPLVPGEQLDHYRRGEPDDPDLDKELRATFGRTPDEPLPDLAKFPPELFEFESPPGTYFDAFPLLLLTERSLRSLAERAPDSKIDVRRFRPNLLLETGDESPFPELAWVGKRLSIGSAVVSVRMDCPRCVMVTHGFADLPRAPDIMRKLVREAEGSLGVYASVETAGEVRVGDPVRVLDD